MNALAKEIAQLLLDAKAVKVSMDPPFTWTSGIKSPIYCDNRVMIAFPEARKKITKSFQQLIQEQGIEVDYIAGTATAGIPWAAFLAYEMEIPMVYVRSEPKGHGAGKQIEGTLPEGKRVVLIEDLISTGGSSMKAVQVLRNEGKAEVKHLFSIMNYQLQKGEATFHGQNLQVSSLTNFGDLMQLAQQLGYIQDLSAVLEFQKNPEEWGNKFLS